jgi:hypothetical protein
MQKLLKALAATSPGGVEAGDLFHAIDRVRSIVEDGLSLIDAAAALEDDAEESSEVESLPLINSGVYVFAMRNEPTSTKHSCPSGVL